MQAVCTPSVSTPTCEPNDTLRAAAQRMSEHHASKLAVRADQRVVAVIGERELVRAVADGADPSRARVHEYAIPADDETGRLGGAAWWLERLDGNWRY